jgi:NADH:ubiquinone oxidoreductase subunit C
MLQLLPNGKVNPLSSPAEATPRQDQMREQLLSDVTACLGDALVESHINVGNDLCVRIATDAWVTSAAALKASLGFDYFCFLSAIDWMPSPFGKGEEDPTAEREERSTEIKQGLAGGETRMQVFARLVNHRTHVGVFLLVQTGMNEKLMKCSASHLRVTPTCATCTCLPISRGTHYAKTSHCCHAW